MNRDELDEILDLHDKWLRGEEGGERADLRGADLRGADLRGANLRGADLRGATLPDGVLWETYLAEVVPGLLQAGGRDLSEVATEEHWSCRSWDNCPVSAAFGCDGLDGVPPLYREQARQFVQFFDDGLIPMPTTTEVA